MNNIFKSMNLGSLMAVLVWIGILNMPYGYYELLKIGVTISSLIFCFQFIKKKRMNMVYLWGFIAILFNPLIPIILNRMIWEIIDMIVGSIFYALNPATGWFEDDK